MSKRWYVGLYERSGIMARPWVEAGYEALCVDIKNTPGYRGGIHYSNADLRDGFVFPIPVDEVAFLASFSPCTDVAVSGARWFATKGPRALGDAICQFATGLEAGEASCAPYMCENPVSVLSTHVRKPDHIFHPCDYDGWCEFDNYTKRTCLWTGGGFVMPPVHSTGRKPDDRIHKAPPGPERAGFRSATPEGFARAVFHANTTQSRPTENTAPRPRLHTAKRVRVEPLNSSERSEVAASRAPASE